MRIKLVFTAFTSLLILVFLVSCVQVENPPAQAVTDTPTATQAPTQASVSPTPAVTTITQAKPLAALSATSPTPTALPVQPTPTASTLPPKDCTDVAGFFGDVTVPDGTAFKQNTAFVKTWRVRNEGTCTWGPNYSLVFHGGDLMSGPLSSPLPAAAPGAIIDISVNLVSPSSGGTFTGFWEFQDPYGKRFGVNSNGIDQIWVKIGVTVFNDSGVIVEVGSTPAPTATSQPAADATGVCTPQEDKGNEQQILGMINDARSKQGLNPLQLSSKLSAAAYAHSADMACNNYVDHAGSDGSTWYTRIKAAGYNYSYATENIYVGNPAFGGTPQGAFDWWMNSQVHRDNILSTRVTEIGIGYAYDASSTYGGYYTLDFAKP